MKASEKQKAPLGGDTSSTTGMQKHKHTQGIVMVCVTRQRTCEKLIARGGELAEECASPLHVLHAVRLNENFLGDPSEGDALEYLFTAARLSGGELTVIRTEDVEKLIVEYATAHAARVIVLGVSPTGGEFVSRMERRLPEVKIVVV